MIVDELPGSGNSTTAAMARGNMARSAGPKGRQPDASTPTPPSESGETDNWVLSHDRPLAEDRTGSIDATGMVLQEHDPKCSFTAAAPEQAGELINLSLVQDAIGVGRTAPYRADEVCGS